MDTFLFIVELLGTVAFAISGAITAVEKGMDLFGVAVLGITTATGGGILRDLILGSTPPVAFRDPVYLLVAAGGVAAVLSALAAPPPARAAL